MSSTITTPDEQIGFVMKTLDEQMGFTNKPPNETLSCDISRIKALNEFVTLTPNKTPLGY